MTGYAKQMLAAGFVKMRVGEIPPGTHVRVAGVDRVVKAVTQRHRSSKTVEYADGTSEYFGNAYKLWAKAVNA